MEIHKHPNFKQQENSNSRVKMTQNEAAENTKSFREHFRLLRKEEFLDFVNIPLDSDIPLYIDPYAISTKSGQWYEECNDLIVDFFEKVLFAIRSNDYALAYNLLSKLGEPNETHLGVSSGFPDGCGVGKEQAGFLLEKLKNSNAARTGYLKDLADCELMIEGIGADKISDIITNIIRGKLIEYTERQCLEYNIPYQDIMSNSYWTTDNGWSRRNAKLPFYEGKPILLVPKNIVVRVTSSNYEKFYDIIIVPYYEELHISMNSQLVRVLKNGKIKVNKKDIEKICKRSKSSVNDFIEEHPELLEKYKATRV